MNPFPPKKPQVKQQATRDNKTPDGIQVRSTPIIKFKDKAGRGGVKFNLKTDFGFVPEEMIVQKVRGKNNAVVVHAVLTQEQLDIEKKERDKQLKKQKNKKVSKSLAKKPTEEKPNAEKRG